MFIFFNFCLIFSTFIIQTTIIKYFSIFQVKPDLVLLVSVYAGLFGGGYRGVAIGTILGFMQDCMSINMLGINTLSKGFIGYFLGFLKIKVLSENGITQLFFIFFSSLFDGFFSHLITNVFMQFEVMSSVDIFFQAVYNTVLGYILFFCIAKVEVNLGIIRK